MVRTVPVLAGLAMALTLAASAVAEDAPGRFQIAPGEGGGFVRLDTRTGAVAHCARRDGSWYCEPLAGVDSGLESQLSALAAEVKRLARDVDRLSAEVQALRGAAPTPAVSDREKQDAAIGFAERVMGRFFELVREMKRKDEGGG